MDKTPVQIKRTKQFKTDEALCEFNHGLILEKLATDPEVWTRLRKLLRENHPDLEKCVEKGSTPLFGYPLLTYSPVFASLREYELKNPLTHFR